MCGIFASIGFEPDPTRIDIISHRGPDGRGWETFDSPSGPVSLGHRRLAILDLSDAGLQPMDDHSGRYSMVFNGEIYNYIELKEELKSKGETFVSTSDSEVLLTGYRVWGRDVLERLRGMFAFVIWDRKEKKLFVARDRFGIKPLYYAVGKGGVAFASEIKQLLGLPGIDSAMNVGRIHDFAASGISDHTSQTMFADVMQIRGGEFAEVETPSNGVLTPKIERYYAISQSYQKMSEAEAAEKFEALLEQSVAMHLRSDVPIGSCLSGGLDSSSLVCLSSEQLKTQSAEGPFNTFSACYSQKQVNERPFMEMVVDQTGATPHYLYPDPMAVFEKSSDITWHNDEPFGSTSIFAQWCVFEEAKRAGMKVMLDGQGADEQLAGYHGGFGYYINDLVRRGRFITLLRTLFERKKVHGESVIVQLGRVVGSFSSAGVANRLRAAQQNIKVDTFLDTELFKAHDDGISAEALASRELGLPEIRDVATLCLNLVFGSNLSMLLHWEDRNSMAHSIEARVPFLDHPLVEFCLSLGNDHKMVGSDTKRVLRRAMADRIPKPILKRYDKLGFTTPEEDWFRGPLRDQMHDGVEATLAQFPDLFEVEGTRRLRDDMLNGNRRMDFTLWRLVNIGMWGKRFGVSI